MAQLKNSSQLFSMLGGTSWIVRDSDLFAGLTRKSSKASAEEALGLQTSDAPDSNQPIDDQVSSTESPEQTTFGITNQSLSSKSENLENLAVNQAVITDKQSNNNILHNTVVVLGSGLDLIWENEDEEAWQLWQNIVFAFGWQDFQTVFYDLDHLVSEGMVLSTIEEVIESGVEWVLTMDADHAIAEQLVDGVQVIEVPDFESMLSDPHAKKGFYESVMQFVN
jgi:hypothetical protein